MKRIIILLAVFITIASGVWWSIGKLSASETGDPLPDILREQTFIYDELEKEEGNVLYTLTFTLIMIGTMGVNLTKGDLLELNSELNKIRKS